MRDITLLKSVIKNKDQHTKTIFLKQTYSLRHSYSTYLFCIYMPRPHCSVAILGQGLSPLWAGTGWESCAAGLVSGSGAHWIMLANSTVHRDKGKERKEGMSVFWLFFFFIDPSDQERWDDVWTILAVLFQSLINSRSHFYMRNYTISYLNKNIMTRFTSIVWVNVTLDTHFKIVFKYRH